MIQHDTLRRKIAYARWIKANPRFPSIAKIGPELAERLMKWIEENS